MNFHLEKRFGFEPTGFDPDYRKSTHSVAAICYDSIFALTPIENPFVLQQPPPKLRINALEITIMALRSLSRRARLGVVRCDGETRSQS